MPWVYLPTCPCSLAREGLTLEPASSEASAPSAMSNTTPTPKASSCPVCGTEDWIRPRCGTTLEPSMESRGAAALTLFLEGFPVRTFLELESKSASWKESDQGFGKSLPASFAKWDQDSYLWRMFQDCLWGGGLGVVLGDLASFGFNARWGMHGACAVGAPHSRERVFLVAHHFCYERIRNSMGHSGTVTSGDIDAEVRCENWNRFEMDTMPPMVEEWGPEIQGCPEPPLLRVADGVAPRLDRTRLAGNGVVRHQSVPAWQKIKDMIGDGRGL